MKRCVITGASGLIGSNLIGRLRRAWEVHAISRHPPAGNPADNVIWHKMDLAKELDRQALPERADALIYLAQSEHFRDFPERALDIFGVNTMGLVRALDYARGAGVRTFVYGSSGGVYGYGETSMNEKLVIPAEGGLGFYLGTKLCSEIVALNYSALMSVVILRFFFVYGPGQRRTMLIPRLIDTIREGRQVALQGTDGVRLNPTYVLDAAAAIERALELEGTYKINVAGPEVLTLREMCEIIGGAVGRPPVYSIQPGAPRHIVGDISKMRELLVSPRIRFGDGLRLLLSGQSSGRS